MLIYMSFFLFKNKPSLSFVFNIRDTSISLAAVRFETDKKPEIILCQSFELKQQDSKYYKEYLSSMLGVLDEAVVSIRKGLVKIGNKEKIGHYYFFVGSPWSVSEAKTVKITRDKMFEINNKMLGQIIIEEESVIERNLEEKTLKQTWKVLEEKIIQAKINGYKIDNFYGKKTTNLTIELFTSFVPTELKERLSFYLDAKASRSIKRHNNSCILSSYSFFRDLYLEKNDFIYVDIGKLITDVYVVRDDIVFGIASFPFGEENIIQASLLRTNLSRDIFMSHISIGKDSKYELISHNNVEDLLKMGFDIWEEKLKDSLLKICTEMNIPNNMFVITNSEITNLLIRNLSIKEKNKQLQIMRSKIKLSHIYEHVLNNFVSNGKDFANEPYIKMDIIFLNKVLAGKQ